MSRLLIGAADDGKLDFRADAARHQGDYARIVQGINHTLDAVIAPVQEASRVLAKISAGDLAVRVPAITAATTPASKTT